MDAIIKVENNLKEILKFLEEKGYKWSSGDLPTAGVNWGSRLILVTGKTLTYRSITSYNPNAITFEEFKNAIDMKTNNILPGHKLVLENGNVFVVMEYRDTKIVFPEGSSRSVTSLEDLCNDDLSPKPGMILIDDRGKTAIVIPHKSSGIAFVSYDNSCSWSACLNNVLYGKLKEIRDFPRGSSLTDGELLWRETKYRINDGVELDEEQFRKDILSYSGKEVRVRVI